MTRNKRMLTIIGLVAMALIGTASAAIAGNNGDPIAHSIAQTKKQKPQIPAEIRVPPGHRAIGTFPAEGMQSYQCKNNEWVFVQPDAIVKVNGVALVLHSAGPVWTSVRDGSSVTGAVEKTSPVDGAIPQLLLRATANRGVSGDGLFSDVTFVQRLNTQGGLAPKGSCQDGQSVSVPYRADYRFWVAK